MDKPFGYEPKIARSNRAKDTTCRIGEIGKRACFRHKILKVRVLYSVLYKNNA